MKSEPRRLGRKIFKLIVIMETYRIWDTGLEVAEDMYFVRNMERRRSYVHWQCSLERQP